MPKITSQVDVDAPVEVLWTLAQDVKRFPQIMPDLDGLDVLEESETGPQKRRTVTHWKARIKQLGRKLEWVEEDIWDGEARTCSFWQIRGDLTAYSGVWKFAPQGEGKSRADLELEYKLEIPLVGAMMQKVVQKLVQENCDGMLGALKTEAEKEARNGTSGE